MPTFIKTSVLTIILVSFSSKAWSQNEYLETEDYKSEVKPTIALKIRHDVRLSEPYVYLGDLLFCDGNAEVCERLQAQQIGSSPDPGQRATFYKDNLLNLARSVSSDMEFTISGRNSVVVTSLDWQPKPFEILSTLPESIIYHPENGMRRVKIVKVATTRRLKLWQAAADFTLISSIDEIFGSSHHHATQNRLLWFEAKQKITGLELTKRFEAQVKLQYQCLTPVAASFFEKDTELTSDDLTTLWLPCSRLYLESEEAIVGKSLRRSVNTHQPIRSYDLKPTVFKKRGDIVEVSLKSGDLKVKARAKVMARAFKGERISVQLLGSKKRVYVQVKPSGEIEVVN